ncbi:hypothetical protein Tco_0723445 [Tanacetum coccineum]
MIQTLLEEEKARRRGRVFNWETATYGKIRVDDDLHDLRSVEAEFPALVIDDAFAPQDALLCKSQVSTPVNDEIDFRISFDKSDDDIRIQKTIMKKPTLSLQHNNESDLNNETSLSEYDEVGQNVLYFNDLFPFNVIHPDDLKLDEDNDNNEIDIIQSSEDMAPLPPREVEEDLQSRDTPGSGCGFSGDARAYEGRGPLVWELILEFLSTLRFGEVLLDLDAPDTIQFQLGGAKRRLSWRHFILALGLHTGEEMESPDFARYWSESERMILGKGDLDDYWRSISTDGDFLGPPLSYTLIRDPMLRLCHKMMAHSIAGRSQAPKKVTVTDLLYLRGLDVGSINIPYLLARYLRRFAAGRKSGAHIFGEQFLDDTCAWVAMGPKRQPDAAAGAPGVAQDAPIVDESGQADPAPAQAPPPPLAAARTMPQRMARLEEDMHEIRGTLAEQREVISAMAHDFSIFCTWTTTSLARMIDRAGVTYTSYSETPREYTRRVRRRTDGASTSIAQQGPQQPDP